MDPQLKNPDFARFNLYDTLVKLSDFAFRGSGASV